MEADEVHFPRARRCQKVYSFVLNYQPGFWVSSTPLLL
ncbi:hypothetical protein B0I21_104199 [Sphingobacterium paludis]|uniref:Uncharacterized protein n=1 Tax=Sphingobacterium paludis TaxID=1476465 RepID=A0A4R7CZ26_9SPHI|nr:hypothetical protein B0I21_104199 [Sphingobacterium paludis]